MSKATRAFGLEHLELERLRVQVGRLFAALQEAAEEVASPSPGGWAPPVDLCESNEAVTIRVEVPGVRAGQITLTVTNERLLISGEKKRSLRGRFEHLCSERNYGRFGRTVSLQRWSIRPKDATAELKNGVLTVRLPKLADRRGAEFKVPVKALDE